MLNKKTFASTQLIKEEKTLIYTITLGILIYGLTIHKWLNKVS